MEINSSWRSCFQWLMVFQTMHQRQIHSDNRYRCPTYHGLSTVGYRPQIVAVNQLLILLAPAALGRVVIPRTTARQVTEEMQVGVSLEINSFALPQLREN